MKEPTEIGSIIADIKEAIVVMDKRLTKQQENGEIVDSEERRLLIDLKESFRWFKNRPIIRG